MKNRIGVVILVLVLVCIGLGIALVAIKKQAGDQLHEAAITNNVLSTRLIEANDQLDRQKQVNADLYADREKRLKELDALTNRYVASLTTLAQVSNDLAKTELALKTSQEETAKRDAKIADLESRLIEMACARRRVR